MSRLALAGLCVLGLSSAALAQGTPSLPTNCGAVEGDFAITSVTADAIAGTLSGDVAGDLAGTVTETIDNSGSILTFTMVRFAGTVTTATGTLEVTGRLLTIGFNFPAIPGMPPLPTGSIEALKLLVTGGTGDMDGKVGLIAGAHATFSALPPTVGQGYHGVICDAPAAPPPTP